MEPDLRAEMYIGHHFESFLVLTAAIKRLISGWVFETKPLLNSIFRNGASLGASRTFGGCAGGKMLAVEYAGSKVVVNVAEEEFKCNCFRPLLKNNL